MRKLFIFILMGLTISCAEKPEEEANPVLNKKNKDSAEANKSIDIAEVENDLKSKGYQTFTYKEGDTTYLMQQYYMVFLKSGPRRDQDSITSAELQKKHLAHLERMAVEGYTSLTGPMGDDGDLKGIVVYNTATQKEADSLAKLDPMVQAGRLIVEVYPWWVAKGGKLN